MRAETCVNRGATLRRSRYLRAWTNTRPRLALSAPADDERDAGSERLAGSGPRALTQHEATRPPRTSSPHTADRASSRPDPRTRPREPLPDHTWNQTVSLRRRRRDRRRRNGRWRNGRWRRRDWRRRRRACSSVDLEADRREPPAVVLPRRAGLDEPGSTVGEMLQQNGRPVTAVRPHRVRANSAVSEGRVQRTVVVVASERERRPAIRPAAGDGLPVGLDYERDRAGIVADRRRHDSGPPERRVEASVTEIPRQAKANRRRAAASVAGHEDLPSARQRHCSDELILGAGRHDDSASSRRSDRAGRPRGSGRLRSRRHRCRSPCPRRRRSGCRRARP